MLYIMYRNDNDCSIRVFDGLLHKNYLVGTCTSPDVCIYHTIYLWERNEDISVWIYCFMEGNLVRIFGFIFKDYYIKM